MSVMPELAVIASSLVLGSMVFFAAVVAPAAFRFLEPDAAAAYLRGLFPRYYLWGVITAVISAALAAPVNGTMAAVLAVVALAFAGVRQVLVPRINDARDGRAAGDLAAAATFRSLHRISVLINLAQMSALACAIGVLAR
jgi:uncharacterized membrane protein